MFSEVEISVARDSLEKAKRGGLPDCWVDHVSTLAAAVIREAEREKAAKDHLSEALAREAARFPVEADLATLVRRLSRKLESTLPGNQLSILANGYLRRKGLQGSILREDTDAR
jgi:hypothetical protein